MVLKIIAIIVCAVLAIIIGGTLFLRITLQRNGKERKPKEEIYNGEGEKNVLIIYQPSPHGTVAAMAKAAATAFQEKGYTVIINHPSSQLAYDPADYDVLCFGSAVYIGTVSPALIHYIERNPFSGKSVFLFAVGSNLSEKTELGQMEAVLSEGNTVSKIKVKKGEEDLINGIIRGNVKKDGIEMDV